MVRLTMEHAPVSRSQLSVAIVSLVDLFPNGSLPGLYIVPEITMSAEMEAGRNKAE